jgi:hypothetical protein
MHRTPLLDGDKERAVNTTLPEEHAAHTGYEHDKEDMPTAIRIHGLRGERAAALTPLTVSQDGQQPHKANFGPGFP